MPKKGPSSIEDRLHRVEGQIRGIERMLGDEEEVQKVTIQIQAAISSLERIKLELVKKEIKESLLESVDSIVDLL